MKKATIATRKSKSRLPDSVRRICKEPDVTIYHNPRCNTSRTVLKMLREQGIEPEIVLYLEDPPDEKELREVLALAGLRPIELLRRKEPLAKELGIGTKAYTDAQLIKLMAEHPILIERPVVIRGKKAVLARPPERVRELLKR